MTNTLIGILRDRTIVLYASQPSIEVRKIFIYVFIARYMNGTLVRGRIDLILSIHSHDFRQQFLFNIIHELISLDRSRDIYYWSL